MKDFDAIKEIWQQSATAGDQPPLALVNQRAASSKTILTRRQLRGAVMLVATAIYIAWLGFFSPINFAASTTYAGILLMITVVLIQAGINGYTWHRLRKIDDTLAPAAHLQQWEAYYQLRKNQVKLHHPLYFIFLNLSFGLYFIEIFTGRPWWGIAVVIILYSAWMLYAYFVLGKRAMVKEEAKLKAIIDDLRRVTGQLTNNA
jgi:hypothetical protein